MYKDKVMLFSMDDKAKVKVGVPCISHLVKSRKFFMKDLGPQTTDHDFFLANGLLLIPSGTNSKFYI